MLKCYVNISFQLTVDHYVMFSADILLRLNLQYIHSKNQSLENIFKEKE